MPLRDYIFENLRWKIAALLLAILTWFSIQFFRKGLGDWRAQTLHNQPVHVLMTPGEHRSFRIEPPAVDLVLRPRPGAVRNLSEHQVEVFVNMTDIPDMPGLSREVLVYTQGQFDVLRIDPKVVSVERIGRPKETVTNSLTKP